MEERRVFEDSRSAFITLATLNPSAQAWAAPVHHRGRGGASGEGEAHAAVDRIGRHSPRSSELLLQTSPGSTLGTLATIAIEVDGHRDGW